MTIASYPTKVSFTYGNGIALKGVKGDIPWNNGLAHIFKFVNITNITDSSWINITFYYDEEDVSIVDETTLALYEWDGNNWNEIPSIHDMENNTINANISTFSIYGIFGTLDMTIELHLGWNLITIPTEVDWTAHDLGSSISGCTLVVKWNASIQKYIAHYVPWETLNNFDIQPGEGYWIYVKHGSELRITGYLVEEINVTLYPGLNLLGWANLHATNMSAVINEGAGIPGVNYDDFVAVWNSSSQDWAIQIVGLPQIPDDKAYEITIGEAFFVYRSDGMAYWKGGRD
ncbi:MAG: hypothetical protein J7L80_04710 [Thermoplasmata archaeon]|nr:hypothetical protein [Thermoplasmata archaeon]